MTSSCERTDNEVAALRAKESYTLDDNDDDNNNDDENTVGQ